MQFLADLVSGFCNRRLCFPEVEPLSKWCPKREAKREPRGLILSQENVQKRAGNTPSTLQMQNNQIAKSHVQCPIGVYAKCMQVLFQDLYAAGDLSTTFCSKARMAVCIFVASGYPRPLNLERFPRTARELLEQIHTCTGEPTDSYQQSYKKANDLMNLIVDWSERRCWMLWYALVMAEKELDEQALKNSWIGYISLNPPLPHEWGAYGHVNNSPARPVNRRGGADEEGGEGWDGWAGLQGGGGGRRGHQGGRGGPRGSAAGSNDAGGYGDYPDSWWDAEEDWDEMYSAYSGDGNIHQAAGGLGGGHGAEGQSASGTNESDPSWMYGSSMSSGSSSGGNSGANDSSSATGTSASATGNSAWAEGGEDGLAGLSVEMWEGYDPNLTYDENCRSMLEEQAALELEAYMKKFGKAGKGSGHPFLMKGKGKRGGRSSMPFGHDTTTFGHGGTRGPKGGNNRNVYKNESTTGHNTVFNVRFGGYSPQAPPPSSMYDPLDGSQFGGKGKHGRKSAPDMFPSLDPNLRRPRGRPPLHRGRQTNDDGSSASAFDTSGATPGWQNWGMGTPGVKGLWGKNTPSFYNSFPVGPPKGKGRKGGLSKAAQPKAGAAGSSAGTYDMFSSSSACSSASSAVGENRINLDQYEEEDHVDSEEELDVYSDSFDSDEMRELDSQYDVDMEDDLLADESQPKAKAKAKASKAQQKANLKRRRAVEDLDGEFSDESEEEREIERAARRKKK
eukprot:g17345.t1